MASYCTENKSCPLPPNLWAPSVFSSFFQHILLFARNGIHLLFPPMALSTSIHLLYARLDVTFQLSVPWPPRSSCAVHSQFTVPVLFLIFKFQWRNPPYTGICPEEYRREHFSLKKGRGIWITSTKVASLSHSGWWGVSTLQGNQGYYQSLGLSEVLFDPQSQWAFNWSIFTSEDL